MPGQDWIEPLYREHRRALFLTAWNILHCPGLAEDAVQAAFVQLARMDRKPLDSKLYAFRSVRNAAIDIARTVSRRHEVPEDGARWAPAEPIPFDETEGAIGAALNQLDDRAREVIELHLHAGLTFAEIANLLDEPLATVASRYRRSLEKLRHLLDVCHG